MSEQKRLGKIKDVYYGHGGYQDAFLGLHLVFGGDGWGCGKSLTCPWDPEIMSAEGKPWSEEERNALFAKGSREISSLLKKAKVSRIDKLVGIPVELVFDGDVLKSFRILEEVL